MDDINEDNYLDDAMVPADPMHLVPKSDKFDHNTYNGYIQAKVRIMRNGIKQAGKVIARKRDGDNQPIGKGHVNPLLDT